MAFRMLPMINVPTMARTSATPTPAAANSGDQVPDLRTAGVSTSVSLPAGVYGSPQSVTLSSASGSIHYTLDGSLPRVTSPTYGEPLAIHATTVLRARAAPGTPAEER